MANVYVTNVLNLGARTTVCQVEIRPNMVLASIMAHFTQHEKHGEHIYPSSLVTVCVLVQQLMGVAEKIM